MTPSLTTEQHVAVRRIAAREDGVWARARLDGTAEAYTPHRGGLRRFVLDAAGREIAVETIPPTPRFLRGRRVALVLVGAAALSAAELVRRSTAGAEFGEAWLLPISLLGLAFLVAAFCFGIFSRLPPRSWDSGPWLGLPGPGDGDLSGHTMPGLVREHPIFSGFWLVVLGLCGSAVGKGELGTSGAWLGLGAALALWWAIMLGFSRGWISEGD